MTPDPDQNIAYAEGWLRSRKEPEPFDYLHTIGKDGQYLMISGMISGHHFKLPDDYVLPERIAALARHKEY